MQRLLGGHPGVEHGGNVLDIRLKGPRWGTQVTEDVRDDIGQGRLAVVAFTVIIKSLVLRKKPEREKKKIETQNALKKVRKPFISSLWHKKKTQDRNLTWGMWGCGQRAYFILAHSSGDKLRGAGRKLRRLGDGIHVAPSPGSGRCAAAIGVLQGLVWFFHI